MDKISYRSLQKISYRLLLVLLMGLPVLAFGQVRLTITNNTGLARVDEVVSVSWKELLSVKGAIDTSMLLVKDVLTGRPVPYQFETGGSGQVQHLLVQVSIPAHSKKTILLAKGKPVRFASKTYSRYIPERKDDFAWENDKIAFRAYGKALEGTSEDAHGFDVWVKRTNELVIDRRYRRDDYHVDHGDGLDYYGVGLTLGAGAVAPYADDSIWYPGNYRQWKILDNGPLRSGFQLTYDTWLFKDKKVALVLNISIDAGSQLHKVEATWQFEGMDSMQVAAGIVKRKGNGSILLDERTGLMGYWEPTDIKHGTTGVACFVPGAVPAMMLSKGQLLTLANVKPGKTFTYYRGAAWDKAGSITGSEAWFRYMKQFREQVLNPLEVTVY